MRKFTEDDMPPLVSWIPDHRAMMMWAGPTFTWPLDERQLLATDWQAHRITENWADGRSRLRPGPLNRNHPISLLGSPD